jgi:pilus assembly protein CpaB
MRALVALCLTLAATVAGAAFIIVPKLVPAPQAQVRVEPPKPTPALRVLVAAKDLPSGTIIKPEHVRWQAWPEQGMSDGFIIEGRSPDVQTTIVSGAVRRGFTAGEPINASRVVQKGEAGFLASALSPGMHAISVKIDAVSGTSGFILPGDRVDVMLTGQIEVDGDQGQRVQRTYAEIVLSDVRILAIDQNMKDVADPEKSQAVKNPATATIEVSLQQAQTVGVADKLGKITLVLAGLVRPDEQPAKTEPSRGYVDELEVSRFLQALKKSADGTTAVAATTVTSEETVQKRTTTVYRGTAPTVVGGK